MPSYLSGAQVLADARLRLSGLPHDQGVLLLEGRDDVRLFLGFCLGGESLLACGKKRTLLEAHQLLRAGEEAQMLFLADCDYDVPTGRLVPAENLIVTGLPDTEADLLALGVLERLILELVPGAVESDLQRREITASVMGHSQALAYALGRFRLLSAKQNLGLAFEGVKLSRYRARGSSSVELEKLARALAARSEGCPMGERELLSAVTEMGGGEATCHGKDLLRAITTVLHQDHGVPVSRLEHAQSMLRLAVTTEAFGRWEVVRRIEAWELKVGRRVLRSR